MKMCILLTFTYWHGSSPFSIPPTGPSGFSSQNMPDLAIVLDGGVDIEVVTDHKATCWYFRFVAGYQLARWGVS